MSTSADSPSKPFPLQGIIGVVSVAAAELDQAVENELQCVEIRADLLIDSGLSSDEVLAMVGRSSQLGLSTLFTLRHKAQGGRFDGDEQLRIALCQQAIAAGAAIVDVEWGTASAQQLLAAQLPLILSYHNFTRMLGDDELQALTEQMSRGSPAAIKIVPMLDKLAHANKMLQWLTREQPDIRRIGFGMGATGVVTRILAPAYGSPVTYTSFSAPVAPGQIALAELQSVYRVSQLDRQTRILALIDHTDNARQSLLSINQQLAANSINAICVRFDQHDVRDILNNAEALQIKGICVAKEHAETVSELADSAAESADGQLPPDTDVLFGINPSEAASPQLALEPVTAAATLELFRKA